MSKRETKIELWASKRSAWEANAEGLPLKIVDDDEAEKASLVVCVRAGKEQERFKADNIYADCADCGCPITYRPYVPKTPPKVCVECAIKRAEQEQCDA